MEYTPKPEHKFTFGLWTVGNVGAAVDRCESVSTSIRPNPAAKDRYAAVYPIYRQLYADLCERMHQLAQLDQR